MRCFLKLNKFSLECVEYRTINITRSSVLFIEVLKKRHADVSSYDDSNAVVARDFNDV